jgi:hypothetical protein
MSESESEKFRAIYAPELSSSIAKTLLVTTVVSKRRYESEEDKNGKIIFNASSS